MSLHCRALLVEDSKPVSFFNKLILERSNFFSEVQISKNGREAITLLNSGFTTDIIFLDINMPVMNGWEFLEEYSQLTNNMSPVLMLLGTELSAEDKQRLQKYPIVKGVREKMLSANAVVEIKNTIFQPKF